MIYKAHIQKGAEPSVHVLVEAPDLLKATVALKLKYPEHEITLLMEESDTSYIKYEDN